MHPFLSNVQYAGRIGLWWPKFSRNDGAELGGGQEGIEQMLNGRIEIACADALLYASRVQVVHELDESGLWLLAFHGCAFNVANLLMRLFLLVFRKGVDVIKDIRWLLNAKRVTAYDQRRAGGCAEALPLPHLCEHVVLRLTWILSAIATHQPISVRT